MIPGVIPVTPVFGVGCGRATDLMYASRSLSTVAEAAIPQRDQHSQTARPRPPRHRSEQRSDSCQRRSLSFLQYLARMKYKAEPSNGCQRTVSGRWPGCRVRIAVVSINRCLATIWSAVREKRSNPDGLPNVQHINQLTRIPRKPKMAWNAVHAKPEERGLRIPDIL